MYAAYIKRTPTNTLSLFRGTGTIILFCSVLQNDMTSSAQRDLRLQATQCLNAKPSAPNRRRNERNDRSSLDRASSFQNERTNRMLRDARASSRKIKETAQEEERARKSKEFFFVLVPFKGVQKKTSLCLFLRYIHI